MNRLLGDLLKKPRLIYYFVSSNQQAISTAWNLMLQITPETLIAQLEGFAAPT